VEVVASLSQSHKAAAQCGLFTHKSVPVIFEPPCRILHRIKSNYSTNSYRYVGLRICAIENYALKQPCCSIRAL